MSWDTSCRDWERRILARESLMPDLPLFEAESARAVAIFDKLRLPDVPGKPRLAEAVGDWFRDAVRVLFGAFDPATGVRHLTEMFILVPKKNSKTTNGAGLMLVAVLMSRRPNAEFLIVAPTHEISLLAFRQAMGMVEADPTLMQAFHIQDHLKRLTYRPTGAFLQIKSFDPRVVTGSKPAGILLDETHVIAEAHSADRVIGQLRGGLVSQPEGFLVQITTQSERAPSGVFLNELKTARAVRDGTLVAPLLPLLYEFPEEIASGDRWRDPSLWPLVLPNDGRSINVARLEPEFRKAQVAGDGELARWASQHLNIQIGISLSANGWVGANYWEQCGDPKLTLDALLARSEVVVVGLDGGGLEDLYGLAVLGRDAETKEWLLWTHAWLHPIAVERRPENASAYQTAIAAKELTLVKTIGDDVREAADIVERCENEGLLDKVGVDQVGIGATLDELEARGIEPERIVGVSQGWRMTGAIKTLERRAAARTLVHHGSWLLAWCVGAARAEPRGNAIIITKQASGPGKIDPLMAAINASELMGLNPEARGKSFWE